MSLITVSEAINLATAALAGQSLPPDVIGDMAQEFVSAELAGTKTHGLGKLISMNYGDPQAEPSITTFGSVMTVDAQGGSGFVVFRKLAIHLAGLADKMGVGLGLVRNFSRISSLYPYPELAVKHGAAAAILANSAGPPAVAPYGGIDPITGTNPICFSFPTKSGTQSLDFSTSAVVWGEIRQAALEGRPLRPDAFLDADGVITNDPGAVNAVLPFGGAKGWALNLALEILCGSIAGAPSGLAVRDEYDCGAVFLVIGSSSMRNFSAVPNEIGRLFDEVRSSRPTPSGSSVRVPGDRHRGLPVSEGELRMQLDVPEATLAKIRLMGEGHSTKELASNPLFN